MFFFVFFYPPDLGSYGDFFWKISAPASRHARPHPCHASSYWIVINKNFLKNSYDAKNWKSYSNLIADYYDLLIFDFSFLSKISNFQCDFLFWLLYSLLLYLMKRGKNGSFSTLIILLTRNKAIKQPVFSLPSNSCRYAFLESVLCFFSPPQAENVLEV